MFREFDRYIIRAVQKLPDWVKPIMLTASFLGSPAAMVGLLALTIMITSLKRHYQLLKAEAWLLASLSLATVLKLITQRVRPDTLYVHNMRFKTYSFPSAHAYISMVVLGFLAYLAVRYWHQPWGIIAAVLLSLAILLIGVSRIYLGAHFPTDVLGGWLLGGIVLFLVIKFVARG
jgi:undecaprenyl-diphosphatase